MALPLDDTRKLVLHNRIERFFLPYQDSALADELVEETGAGSRIQTCGNSCL